MRKIIIIILVIAAIPLYIYNAYILLNGSINGNNEKDISALPEDSNKFSVKAIIASFDSVKYVKHGRSPFVPYPITEKRADVKKPAIVKKTPDATKPEASMPKITINGIMWNPQNPLAMLGFADGSSAVVKTGQIIGEITIKKIEKTSVTIVFAKKEYKIDR